MTGTTGERIAWRLWDASAFAAAAREHKPIILSIVTAWSHGCEEMDRTVYARPDVAALVSQCFIPIRVDADRRPDVASRYTLGGWPTTAFLNVHGELLGGGTYVSVERLPRALQRVLDGFAVAPAAASDPRANRVAGQSPASLPDIEESIFDSFDADAGAFGAAPRFPHTAPIHFALAHTRDDPSSPWANVATTCLDRMGWGGLHDDEDGGFFRCARGHDWSQPQTEKLLEGNAALLSLYLDAFETLQLARYAERAEDVLGFLQQTFADPQAGGWAASQHEAPGYYASAPEARRAGTPPPVDPTLLTGANAAMVSAAIRAARVMKDEGLLAFALKSLERVVLGAYRPGAGVAHCVDADEEVRGLLEDQVTMATALLDAFEATGNVVYEMMAEELARQTLLGCRDERAGGFFDRAASASDVGLLRRPVTPFVANCEAARMLRRLAALSGESEFASLADEALAAVAWQAMSHGPLAAHYALAVRESQVR